MSLTESKNDRENSLAGRHAIVIGGSMAGLLAGRVLAEHFEKVSIVERDHFTDGPEFRVGVPQARHIHLLLKKGQDIIMQLFPDFDKDLEAYGAVEADACEDVCWLHFGVWKPRFSSGIRGYMCSRVLLEWLVRTRMAKYKNVSLLEGVNVTELLYDPNTTRVNGVRLHRKNGEEIKEELNADLVVDTTGRGSKTNRWLKSLNYSSPPESCVNSYIGYASRIYERPNDFEEDWKSLIIFPKPPADKRGGVIFPVEGNRWIVTLGGYNRDYPPSYENGFLEYARSLANTALYEAIKNSRSLTPIYSYKIRGNLWRHYERMTEWPEGFIVLGDSVCSFNPIYGQGMSVCAIEATILNQCLKEKRRTKSTNNLIGISRAFQKKISPFIKTPWMLATNEDLRYPQTEGKRPLFIRFLQWYTAQILELSSINHKVHLLFIEVLHLLKNPNVLFHPYIALYVIGRCLGLVRFTPSSERPKIIRN